MYGKLNPPYAGCRIAADATYKVYIDQQSEPCCGIWCLRRLPHPSPPPASGRGCRRRLLRQGTMTSSRSHYLVFNRLVAAATQAVGSLSRVRGRAGVGESHRHFAVPHRRAGGKAFGGVDNGVGVNSVVAIEVVDGASLAEMLNAESFEPVAAYAAEPTQRGRMAVDHGDDAAVPR